MKQLYSLEQHQIPIQKIDPDALYVLEKLRHAGYIAYLVGGSVRDLLLGIKPKDYDISTSAEPEEIRKLFRNCILIGRRFRLAHIRFGRKVIEVSTFRSGDNEADTLIVRDNVWGTPEEDVLRRDFTLNGLFYDSHTQTIIDFVGGYKDLQKKYLRTIGQSYLRFRQDPVRMIRLIKFQARFGFEVDEEAKIALLECRQEISKSSTARLLEELLRMLESGCSEPFFRLLAEHGFLHLLLPTLGEFMENPESEEIFSFLQESDAMIKERPPHNLPDRSILLACLVFPLLQRRMQTHFLDREKIPHLGEIQREIHLLLNEVFRALFHLPRRLRISLMGILMAQYRLSPLDRKKGRRLRPSHDSSFNLGLQFFEIRCRLEPALQTLWEEWQDVLKSPVEPTRRRRRRRRKPRPT